jgi:hypothetical protein
MNKPRDLTGHEKDDYPRDHQQIDNAGDTGQKPTAGGRQARDQPSGVPDRTPPVSEAFPREVDEKDGRKGTAR